MVQAPPGEAALEQAEGPEWAVHEGEEWGAPEQAQGQAVIVSVQDVALLFPTKWEYRAMREPAPNAE